MYILLHCPGVSVLSRYWTGGKGLPLANTARPSDEANASFAEHSARDVGFESAKIIGRWLIRAIASITCRVKALATVLTPMMAVGLSDSIAAAKSLVGAWRCA